MIKRYQATEHLTVLNLKIPTSWRESKHINDWREDFRTEGSKIGNLDNMHLLCVPKGRQLEYTADSWSTQDKQAFPG